MLVLREACRKEFGDGERGRDVKRTQRRPALDRARLRKLLAMLGSDQDGEALNAARHVAALVRESGASWDELIPDGPGRDGPGPDSVEPAGSAEPDDLDRLDQLLASDAVVDVLKIKLRAMRSALIRGRLAAADRRLIWLLHRKAVLAGDIVGF
jgi:hypothetical protein